ncbi:MAG: conjugal transfer protein TraG N-terminal domain-containing protein, partial [Betaproteobacteria bacterium]|nr:conjugal transfer protein TraG N-terminal domain-containing protein [Betaproteobacteria bacterium]
MIEVFTTGGGAYVVRGFNAVAAWTQGGGYIAFLEVVTVLAFIYAMMLTVFDLNWKALFNWFMGSTLIYGMLMVPTTSVKVTDTTNPTFGAAVVDNVPMGLGLFAGLTSQISHWLTTQAEVVFSSPASENYSDNGMIYGARLLDQVQSLDIDDPIYGENLDNYIKKCVLYDLYLG